MSFKRLLAVSLVATAGAVTLNRAYAEDAPPPDYNSSGSSEYQPHVGEPITYGKKYYPTETRSNMYLEVNPILLINRGLGFEFETRAGEHTSFGADLQYRDADLYEKNSVRARSQYFAFAPKFRIYPIETMSGVFFGIKLYVGQVSAEIRAPAKDVTRSFFQVAPAVHAGYRITSFGGFSLAMYLGGGINLPKSEIKSSDVPEGADVEDARNAVNKEQGTFRPDLGITLGIAL